jgi:hypothetical protein
MIIDDFDVKSVLVAPPEADSPTIVDPNAVLSLAFSHELLQAVAGRKAQIAQRLRGIDDCQLSLRQALQVRVELSDALAKKDALGVPVAK